MSAHLGAAGRSYDPVKGKRDVRDLGGFSEDDMVVVDELSTDLLRRRRLAAWFGSHGGCWAWNEWCKSRGR